MPAEPTPFGELLKETLRSRGISTSEFSRTIKTSTSNLQNIESGRRAAGAEIVASIVSNLDLQDAERQDMLDAAAAQSSTLTAGMELGTWRAAAHWWRTFGVEAIRSMGLDPDCPDRRFRWQPVVDEKWVILCLFRNPEELVFLGYDEKKARLEAAYRPHHLRASAPLPTRATHWWRLRATLLEMDSDGTKIFSVNTDNQIQQRIFTQS